MVILGSNAYHGDASAVLAWNGGDGNLIRKIMFAVRQRPSVKSQLRGANLAHLMGPGPQSG